MCVIAGCILWFQLKKTQEDMNKIVGEKEELAQRCHVLDQQVSALSCHADYQDNAWYEISKSSIPLQVM